MTIECVNPATGKLVRRFEPLTAEALEGKIALAHEASRSYRLISVEDRAIWMRRLAAILEEEVDELARTMTLEMGKTFAAARQEALKCAACCRYYADEAGEILTPIRIPTQASDSYVRWEPMGVVLAIMPWNFPFWQVFRFLVPALMAGNVGLLKHAPSVPHCALVIEALVRRAGFPRGTFQSLMIEVEQTTAVLSDPRVAAVTLTGSEAAGSAVAGLAGSLLKKTVLELGGSDPFIVMPSTDLDSTVEVAVRARCVNNGQSCIAAKRLLVHDSLYAEFAQRFVATMEALRVGDPMLDETDLGPLASAAARDRLTAQVQAAIAAGGRLLTGGQPMLGEGFYFEPTVIAELPRDAPIAQEEFFGPVALLFRVTDLEDAVACANHSPFGLGASVWTRDTGEQERFITELEAGQVFINVMVASDPRLPFGGTKRSGYGRELSVAGMREFMHPKTVVVA